ncbi:MAG: response regulator [Gammaproteobacteria bacterium]|nr:response regulator [Gammaproteobacteria bacterium]
MDPAKVMIVDTNESGAALAGMLEGRGFHTATALHGEEALRVVAGVAPDLIIMNVQLAGRNGYEITRELRERGLAEGVPVILLTSAQTDGAFHAQREWGMRAGATEVLAKPLEEDELVTRMQALLDGDTPSADDSAAYARAARVRGSGLNERALQELERRLAQYIGPISKMLVRKVEGEVSTTGELYRRLAEHITDKTERERFISWTVTQS